MFVDLLEIKTGSVDVPTSREVACVRRLLLKTPREEKLRNMKPPAALIAGLRKALIGMRGAS